MVKYKKGRLAMKRSGLAQLQVLLRLLTRQDPPLVENDLLRTFLSQPVNTLGGQAMKDYEDSLDALICAYIGYHHWTWRGARTDVFGDISAGYIVNPCLQSGWLTDCGVTLKATERNSGD
jgi:predicted RNase H-like nuclease